VLWNNRNLKVIKEQDCKGVIRTEIHSFHMRSFRILGSKYAV
jgi:hypothetical protein